MNYSKGAWDQLKNKTADDLIATLRRDGWKPDEELRTERVYRSPDGRSVTIHYHSGSSTYGRGLLKGLLADIGWSEADMRRLKLIK